MLRGWHTKGVGWLVCDTRVLASADLADERTSRRKGLLGRSSVEGALILQPCNWVHTFGMKFDIDVAYVDRKGLVLKTQRMSRHRLGLPVLRAHSVIEAQSGSFARWGLHVGDTIEYRGHDVLGEETR